MVKLTKVRESLENQDCSVYSKVGNIVVMNVFMNTDMNMTFGIMLGSLRDHGKQGFSKFA